MGETESFRRKDDRLMGEVLAELRSLNGKVDRFTDALDDLRTGEAQLPQCKENARRLDAIEKKINEHSYHKLSEKVLSLEAGRTEDKESIKWYKRTTIAALIGALAWAARVHYLGK